MFKEIFPAIYRRLRLRAGLSQSELATRLGLCRTTIYKYESGITRPDPEQEQILLELSGCSGRELAELVCEQLSQALLTRVGFLDDRGLDQPATPLGKAHAVLAGGRAGIPDALYRALLNQMHTTQTLGLLLERSCADLEELARDCSERARAEPTKTGASGAATGPSPLPTLPERDAEPALND